MTPDDPKPAQAACAELVALLAALRAVAASRPPQAARSRGRPGVAPPTPDVDPSERTVPANRRAETLVAALLLVAAAFGFGFTAVYILHGNTQLLGIAIGVHAGAAGRGMHRRREVRRAPGDARRAARTAA